MLLNAIKLSGMAAQPNDGLKAPETAAPEVLPPGRTIDYSGGPRRLRTAGGKFLPAPRRWRPRRFTDEPSRRTPGGHPSRGPLGVSMPGVIGTPALRPGSPPVVAARAGMPASSRRPAVGVIAAHAHAGPVQCNSV